jgi:hypothetical protein
VVAWFDASFELGLGAAGRDDLTAYLSAVGAVDVESDQRTEGRRRAETFAYLHLLVEGPARDDRAIWAAALGAALGEGRLGAARARLEALRDRARGGAALEALRPEVRGLLGELERVAADGSPVR